jgi:hypothetical protein
MNAWDGLERGERAERAAEGRRDRVAEDRHPLDILDREIDRARRSHRSTPSIHSDDSCGLVPPMRSWPSRPRTTDGSSGSDS